MNDSTRSRQINVGESKSELEAGGGINARD